jgi:hypothetical protein
MTRRTPFGRGHEPEYGLKTVERRSDGNEVIAVQWQFCVFIGKETREGPGVKRKRTYGVHMFRLPFRQELYRKHLESVHAQDWIAYNALSPEQKRAFFDEKQRWEIHAYLDSTKEFITFDIPNVAIVDELMGNLFFKPELDEGDEETEPISKANVLKLSVSYLIAMKMIWKMELPTMKLIGLSPGTPSRLRTLCGSGSRSITSRSVCRSGRRPPLSRSTAIAPRMSS